MKEHHRLPERGMLSENRVFTVSNGLTLLRILLLPFILYFLLGRGRFSSQLTLLLLSVAVLTDVLDGYFARRLGQVSNLGKILDPLADKITIGAMAVFLMLLRDLPPWVVVLIVGRDVSILAGSLFLIRRHRIIPMSNVPGKVTGAALAALIIVYVVDWRPLTSVIVAVTTAALAVSAISYGAYFWGRLRGT